MKNVIKKSVTFWRTPNLSLDNVGIVLKIQEHCEIKANIRNLPLLGWVIFHNIFLCAQLNFHDKHAKHDF